MDISYQNIKTALQHEDIEGLIALGAPEDEYDHEAKLIALMLDALPGRQRTAEYLVSAIAQVWVKYFNRSSEEILLRTPAFARVAEQLLS